MPNPALIPVRPEYYVQTGSMFDNPHGVPHDEIVSMILEQPAEVSAQVVFGKYVENDGLVFSAPLIQQMIDRTGYHYPDPGAAADRVWGRITGDTWWDKATLLQAQQMSQDQKRTVFHSGWDFARLNDYTVQFTLDTRSRPARVVAYRRLNRVPWEGIYREVGRCAHTWGPSILGDATGMAGDIILDALQERFYCPVHDRTLLKEHGKCIGRDGEPVGGCNPELMVNLGCVDGYQFSKSSKQGLIEHLRNLLSVGYRAGSDDPFGWLRCPAIVTLEEELGFYSWDDKHLDTDTVMALALACMQGLELAAGTSSVGSPYGD